MTRRLWFRLRAVLLHAEHALIRTTNQPGRPAPALILHDNPHPVLGGNGTPPLHATPPAGAVHIDEDPQFGAAPGTTRPPGSLLRLPLRARSPLTGEPLRDVLRRGAHAGHVWCIIDVDPAGLLAITTCAIRDCGDVPHGAAWRAAQLTAAGLGSYPGQTCPGYREHGGVVARFLPAVVTRLIADIRGSHTTTGFSVETGSAGTWLVGALGDRTELRTGAAGWCRVSHPELTWTAEPLPVRATEPEAVFGSGGPHGNLDRCRICGAVDETRSSEHPPTAVYRYDRTTRCTVCGSWEGSHLDLGWQSHPRPWPPQPGAESQPRC
ncbi:hypothetical protein ABT369_19535 [Dactylosporangium sp. NPDC000244]|uniref:hypothetical protein n=1 Tax=Dactylosporangium sp. NPDC000244 TaxID=3154365 RepID=UPI00332F8E8B